MPLAVDIAHSHGIVFVRFTPVLECMGVCLHMHSPLSNFFFFSCETLWMSMHACFSQEGIIACCTRDYFGFFPNTGPLSFTDFKSLTPIINQQ